MRKAAVLMTIVMLSSTLAGCAGGGSGAEKDEQIASLQSELANVTAQVDDAIAHAAALETTLSEALVALEKSNADIANLSVRLDSAEWHKANLTNQLSETMEQLNQTQDSGLMAQLEDQITNLSSQIEDADSQITGLSSELSQKQQEIAELDATVTALQSTMSSLTYNTRDRVSSCPEDNSGTEIVIGYDDGSGAASPDDGKIEYDEIQYTIGECPGDSGMVSGIQAGDSRDWGPALFVEMRGVLYFAADDGEHGWELWRSDGSIGGTYMVKDVREEECTPATDPETGEEFENCENYGSIHQMCWSGYATNCFIPEMVAGNDKIFFTAFDSNPGTNFPHVFVSDGTEDGTYKVRDQWVNWDYNHPDADFDYSGPSNLLILPSSGFISDRVVYTVIQAICEGGSYCPEAFDPASGEELWITDGTDSGTYMLANLVPEEKSWNDGAYCCMDDKGGIPRDLMKKGNQIWFTAQTDSYGREIYRYNMGGIGGGLYLVKDVRSGEESSNPLHLTSASGGVFFSADDGLVGQELHYTQGDAFSTRLVKDIWPGEGNSSSPQELTKLGQSLFFTADDGENGRELWISDNTESGTFMVKDINTNGSSDPNWLRVMDGVLYFMAYTEDYGRELWRSDGTADGTYMMKDINPGSNSSFYWIPDVPYSTAAFYPHHEMLIVHGDSLYFSADSGEQYGVEMWRTDGTVNGTELVIDIASGSESSWPNRYFSLGDKLYFTSYSEERGRQLWFYWDNPGPIIASTESS